MVGYIMAAGLSYGASFMPRLACGHLLVDQPGFKWPVGSTES